jgi:hypothetical protein
MAVNETRNMNGDLKEGLTDGSVKKLAPNRGGFPNDFALAQRMYDTLPYDLYDPSFDGGRVAELAGRQTRIKG